MGIWADTQCEGRAVGNVLLRLRFLRLNLFESGASVHLNVLGGAANQVSLLVPQKC